MVLFGLVLANHYFPKNTAEYSFKSTSLLMLQFAYNAVEAFSGLNFFFLIIMAIVMRNISVIGYRSHLKLVSPGKENLLAIITQKFQDDFQPSLNFHVQSIKLGFSNSCLLRAGFVVKKVFLKRR